MPALAPDPFGLALHALHENRRLRPVPADGFPTDAAEPYGEIKEISDPVKYAESAWKNAVSELEQLAHGNRNNGLNAVAYSLGHLVGAGLLGYDETAERLEQACEDLWPDRDAHNVRGTVHSGLRKGEQQPLQWTQIEPADAFRPVLLDVPAQQAHVVTIDPLTGDVQIERTSWWPKDLAPVIRGDIDPEPPPEFLYRSDEAALFYAGKVNGLIGESESGKTWVALIAVCQALKTGADVLYLDFEDTARGIVGRLKALGATEAELAHLTYVSPDENLHATAERDLRETITTVKPGLVILDGYNAAMTLLGLELSDNTDVTAFSMRVLRPIARTGACVITIDHVTKSKDGRGSYAIGAQAKRADVDGCLIIVEVVQPFGRGQVGRLKLTVSKDRPGHVRAISAGSKNAGEAILRSQENGDVEANVAGPDLRPLDERGPFRPTVLMSRVSELLQAMTEPMSKNAIVKSLGTNRLATLQAVDVLVEEGYAKPSSRGGFEHVKPYRQDQDPNYDPDTQVVPGSRVVPNGSGETGTLVVPQFPPSIGGTGTTTSDGFPSDDPTQERYK